jgi:hypothetical protein
VCVRKNWNSSLVNAVVLDCCISLFRQLLNYGESILSLDRLIDNTQVAEAKPEPIPHLNEKLWFINCDRREAERLLAGQEEGTFLIRPRDQREHPNSYALSIV